MTPAYARGLPFADKRTFPLVCEIIELTPFQQIVDVVEMMWFFLSWLWMMGSLSGFAEAGGESTDEKLEGRTMRVDNFLVLW